METDSNWQLFHQAIEVCLERGDIDKAKVFLKQLYVSIGLYHSEEQDDETTSEAYSVCLAEALQLNETDIAVKCFYRMKLHAQDYIHPGQMWAHVLTNEEMPLAKKLTILRDVQSILKDYKENSVKLLQCIQELQFCYQMLLLRYTNDSPCTDIIFRDVLLFDVGSGWYQLAKGNPTSVCVACKQLEKLHNSDPNLALVMELWAAALERLGKLDVAINKAENAIAMANSRHNKASFEKLLTRLQLKVAEIQEEQTKANHESETNQNKTKDKLDTRQRRPYKKDSKHLKVRKSKVQENGEDEKDSVDIDIDEADSNASKGDENFEIVPTLADNSPKSWKDVTDFDLYVSKPRHKRRRRRTGDSGLSSTGNQSRTLDQESERQSEESFVFSNLHQADLQDSEDEFQPLPKGPLPNLHSSSQTADDQTLLYLRQNENSNGDEVVQEDTFFNESCEGQMKFPETKSDLIYDIDEMILRNGIELSERFIESFSRKKMKFAEYPTLYSKEEALRLCSKDPHKYKHCNINIETAHGAVCTNLNDNDSVKSIEISGRSKCGKVYSEDEVVVEIISEQPECIPRLNKVINANMQCTDKIYGKVVGITKRTRFADIKNPVFLCTIDTESHLMKPLCKTVPKISVLHQNCNNQFQVETYRLDEKMKDLKFKEVMQIDPANRKGYLFLVCLIDWNELYPVGAILSVHSFSESITSSLKVLCLQNQIPTHYKPDTVERTNEIVQNPLHERPGEIRENLADELLVFTIDPPGSKDLDDALSVRKVGDSCYEIGIHIADVASVLEKDDPIDIEALERTRTFYPGEGYQPHHMLPEPLSTNICSLLPNENRNALSVFFTFTFTSSGDVENTYYHSIKKTIIRSSCQFTYEEVQKIISDDDTKSEFQEQIRILHRVANQRRRKRLGNKVFAFPFEGDGLTSRDSYNLAEDAHNLVEEFMILANHEIALHLSRKFPACLPLRVQEKPSTEKMQEWLKYYPLLGKFVLRIQHLPLPDNTRIDVTKEPMKRWNKIFPIQKHVWEKMTSSLKNGDFKKVRQLVGTDELHPMQALAFEAWIGFQESAKYKCSGNLSSRNEAVHFSLGIFPYTHCTSPIRRYSDIIVQRLIHASLDGHGSPYTKGEVIGICEKINDVAKRGRSFEKQCYALHLGKKLSKKSIVCNTIIKGVNEKEVSIHFPGMRNLPSECKDIPFHVLKVNTKPLIKLDEDSRPFATLTWQQRLYSHTGYAPKIQFLKKAPIVRIDPHQRVVFQQIPKWQKILKAIINRKDNHLKEAFFGTDHPDVNMSKSVPACFNTETDVSSEVRDGNIIQQCCDFSMSFSHGQILAIQLSAEPRKGVIVPTVQMVDITNNVKLCIQHISDPVKCFARYSSQRVPRQIKSPVEYVKIWLSIFRMESAVKMTQNIPIVINDLQVIFSEKSEISDCHFILHNSFCLKRDIEFVTLSEKMILYGDVMKDEGEEEDDEPRYLLSCDSVCIRCDLKNGIPTDRVTKETPPSDRQIWIGHGEINVFQKGKKNGKKKIHIRLHKDSPKPTATMCQNPAPRCSVELLQKGDAEKRVEAIIRCLDKATNLAKAIALGKKIPKLDKDHAVLSHKIQPDVTICGLVPNNTQQLKAIQRALSSRFSLIQGPPGTGKTYTGIKLVHLFVEINNQLRRNGGDHKQVVFCGPSNKSVDLVARWMLRKFKDLSPKMVRMYGSSMESSDFQIPGRDYMSKTSCRDSKPDPELESVTLHHLIRAEGKPYSAELRNYDNMFKNNPSFSDHGEIMNYKKILSKACQEELKHYDVIFCTTAVATNWRFLKATQGKIFQMIIDEAGMCTEPETLAPIISSKAEQVVLIGDHKQLQPVVLCSEAASLGLEKSLFERYADQAVFLDCQYRMNPRICDFPSKQFYRGRLETMPSVAWKVIEPLSLWQFPNVPHLFCHVEGEEQTLSVSTDEGNQQSKSNKAEVDEVIRIYNELITREKVNPRQINVISQYNAQCFAIKEAMKKEKFINFNVNTVVASQGGEWDYVIFSTVRSLPDYRIEPNPTLGWCKQNLGFITDQHQINVALTRARKGLIIIGNKNLMKCDKVWKELLDHYGRQGCVVDAECVKSRRHKKKQKPKEASKEEFYS